MKIRELCEEKEITLILLLTPNYNSVYHIKGAASEFNVLDLSQQVADERFFYDDIHLNKDGKEILSTAVLESISVKQ